MISSRVYPSFLFHSYSDPYTQAPILHAQGVHGISTDEKTGIQALERAHPTRPTRPGLVERQECASIRHGTQCLMANCAVATGRILAIIAHPPPM